MVGEFDWGLSPMVPETIIVFVLALGTFYIGLSGLADWLERREWAKMGKRLID